jgi:acetyl esterase/lipase
MRSAQLRLRGGGGLLVWPAAVPSGLMILLVDAGETESGERLCRALSQALGVIALCRGLDDGATAIEWAADHAAQLGAEGARLLLAGVHGGAGVAAALAVRARDDGWPDIARQLLIHPRFDGPPPSRLAGVAPATVVGDRAYAARLREAGVPVDELDDVDGLLSGRPW